MSFMQAAVVPVSGCTALKGLRHSAKVVPGQTVVVNGASGGVGTFAVQIAKALGAQVTGVCSGSKMPLVSSIGADNVIDYRKARPPMPCAASNPAPCGASSP
jgi:NADPH:quinone reductase-like Zn-dependent oxidoreductase